MNHFIEVGESPDGFVCVTIHSGSRNPGHSVADYYIKLSETVDTDLPKGYFHLNSEYGQAYLNDMIFMQKFALKNREVMLEDVLGVLGYPIHIIEDFIDYNMINENHNHADIDKYGNNIVLHRKGATPSEIGQLGIIPGNMRDGVYITEGLGNIDYLCSASHGAGRAMSRSKAKKTILQDTFVEQMAGIICDTDSAFLDEAPDAYKDVQEVIRLQDGIVVKVLYHVKPLLNVKG